MSVLQLEDRFFSEELRTQATAIESQAIAALIGIRNRSCPGHEWTGWFDWPARHGFALAKDVVRTTENLNVYYDLVLVIGIGGSFLGTRAVADALSPAFFGPQPALVGKAAKPRLVYAGQHLSEAGLIEVLDLLDQYQPIVNVISKSGTTTEPGVVFRIVRAYMEKRFGSAVAAERIIATTDASKGALCRLAKDLGYRTFSVPEDVGGRFSVHTAVGLVPLALSGFNIDQFLSGADTFFRDVRQGEPRDHPALRYATLRYAAYASGIRVDILAYNEPKLASFCEWWKQLFGESEGKNGKGLLPVGMAYTTDLHSLGQYVQDGCRHLMETFLTIDANAPNTGKESSLTERRLRIPHTVENADELAYLEGRYIEDINAAAMLGTKIAHRDGGVPCLTLTLPRLDEFALGALMAFFETACGISGALLGVNPYDQPGVEAYKKNLFALLGKPGFEQLGATLRQRL